MLELEQKSECCTKNEVWQTEKPFGHFIILDLADLQLLPFLLLRSTTTSTPALSKAQLCQFFFLQRKNHMCSGSLLLLQRWGDLQRFCAKKTAHESPWIAISGTWSWRTQGEGHEGPGDWRPQRFYIQRGAKHGESHAFEGKKNRSFRICGESSSGQGEVDSFWSPKKHRFGRWQVPVVSSAADKGRLVALNTSSFRGTKTLKISKAIEFQQTNAAIWGLNCKVLQEATRECWDNLYTFFSFFAKVIRLIRKNTILETLLAFILRFTVAGVNGSAFVLHASFWRKRLKVEIVTLPPAKLFFGFRQRVNFLVRGGTYRLHHVGNILT